MLSTENPSPACPETPQPKKGGGSCSSSGSDEEKDSGNNNHHLEVDLCESGLVDNTRLPKFSIRDYVSNTRGKDIANHWPFSPRTLQLCLKHGVSDVLPPFQTLDLVRNLSTVESNKEIIRSSDAKLSGVSDCDNLLSESVSDVGGKLALDVENHESSESKEDNENPLTTAALCCSDIDSEILAESSAGKQEFSFHRASYKVESNSPSLVKKSRLIAKLSDVVEPKPNQELSVDTSAVPETMASKVCPVCKTFSSTSNTTLNAHIDQCLSDESTAKCTANSKLIKHRIKPRKTRSMADVYQTSMECTLEDLDRRNGTNWASNSDFPTQEEMEMCTDEKNNVSSSVNSEDGSNKDVVYFDSNGTKLRILSRFDDQQSKRNTKDDDYSPGKPFEIDKGSKLILGMSKKSLVHRHKLAKHHPSEERSCSPKERFCGEVNKALQRKFGHEEDKKEEPSQQLEANDQMKSDDYGMIKQWIGSKRTVAKKKINPEHENQYLSKIIKGMRRNNLPSPRLQRIEGCSLLESSVPHSEQLRNDGSSVHKRRMDPPSGAESRVSSQSMKKITSTAKDISSDGSFVGSRIPRYNTVASEGKKFGSSKRRGSDHATLSGDKKFMSSTKTILSVRGTSLPQSKTKSGKKKLNFKKPRLLHISGSDEETAVSLSAIYRQENNQIEAVGRNAAQMEKASCKLLSGRTNVLKAQKTRAFVNSSTEENTASKCADTSPEFQSRGAKNSLSVGNDPATSNAPDSIKDIEIEDGFVHDPNSKGEAYMSFGESLESGFPDPDGSQLSVKEYERHRQADKVYCGEDETFRLDKDGEGLVALRTLGAQVGDGEDPGTYFVDVDPIPIPGPPGSFLPSPGRTGSEELHGTSSLTTCRIHSSEDEHELIDMDSSDSPVSAMSFAPNSVAARSDSTSIVKLMEQSHHVQNEPQCDISEDRMDPVVESTDGKPKLGESGANSILPVMSPRAFKNPLPCRCCRKEGVLNRSSFNFQLPELQGRRTMTSVPPRPSHDKQIGCGPNNITREAKNIAGTSSMGNATILFTQSPEAKLQGSSDCESPSPSTSGPVLRLMGKNLMVMNKEESLSPQTSHSGMENDNLTLQPNKISRNTQNEHQSFCHTSSRGSSIFASLQNGITGQYLDFSSDGPKVHANFGTPKLSPHPSEILLPSKGFCKSPISSFHRREYVEKVCAHIPQLRPSDPSLDKYRETSMISDPPDTGPNLASKPPNGAVSMELGGSSIGISAASSLGQNSRGVNPFYNYQVRCFPIHNVSQMVQNGSSRALPSKGTNENLANWDPSPRGSTELQPDSPKAASPSTGPLRSSLCYTPGFFMPKNFTC